MYHLRYKTVSSIELTLILYHFNPEPYICLRTIICRGTVHYDEMATYSVAALLQLSLDHANSSRHHTCYHNSKTLQHVQII